MSYHYKDIYRILIPGIVLFFMLQFALKDNATLMDSLIPKDTTNKGVFYVFFIPIAGFLLGYANNFFSALIEKLIYCVLPRPSRTLLRGTGWLIRLGENTIDTLKGEFPNSAISKTLSSKDAYKIFSVANQHLKDRNDMIETNYNYMIFARNMFLPSIGLMIIACTLVNSFCACQYLWIGYILSIVAFIIFPFCVWQWYSFQHTKYILASYANS